MITVCLNYCFATGRVNFPDTLNSEELQRWKFFCQQRLSNSEFGAPNTLEAFNQARLELMVSATPFQQQVLEQWQEYADSLAAVWTCDRGL